MAEMNASMRIEYNTTWDEVIQEAGRIGVPSDAKFSVHVSPHYNQLDPGYTELKWSWKV